MKWNQDTESISRRIADVATGKCSLRFIAGGSRLAFALPANRLAARMTVDLYQPQRITGRIFKALVQLLISFGLLRFFKAGKASNEAPSVDWLKAASDAESIGFLGCNPNHGLRCIITGYDPVSNQRFLAKLGFDQSAFAVTKEYNNLEIISKSFQGNLTPISFDTGTNWAMLRIPHLGNKSIKSINDERVARLLESWLLNESRMVRDIPRYSELLARAKTAKSDEKWIGLIENKRVRAALVHGDFAIWNIKVSGLALQAIDWEHSEVFGLSGIDLIHGLRQEAHMIHRMSPKKTISWIRKQATSSLWQSYLTQSGWMESIDELIVLGLLHSHFNTGNPSADLLLELGIEI